MSRVMMLASAVLAAGIGVGAVSVAGAAGAAGAVGAVGVTAGHGAKIVAKPDRVMVNKRTTLTGSGFRRHRKLTIWECSATFWVIPQQICNHRNAVVVRTGARGGFMVKFKALVCPKAPPGISSPAVRVRHCFVGVPTFEGVDSYFLAGATRITVTRR